MVRERNQFITGMKSELYRKEYRNDTERVDLQTQVLQKDKIISALEVCGWAWLRVCHVVIIANVHVHVHVKRFNRQNLIMSTLEVGVWSEGRFVWSTCQPTQ